MSQFFCFSFVTRCTCLTPRFLPNKPTTSAPCSIRIRGERLAHDKDVPAPFLCTITGGSIMSFACAQNIKASGIPIKVISTLLESAAAAADAASACGASSKLAMMGACVVPNRVRALSAVRSEGMGFTTSTKLRQRPPQPLEYQSESSANGSGPPGVWCGGRAREMVFDSILPKEGDRAQTDTDGLPLA